MDSLGPLLNAGSAGAVIIAVILFLKFISTQRTEDRVERMGERQLWSAVIDKHNDVLKTNSERLAVALDGLGEKINGCPLRKPLDGDRP